MKITNNQNIQKIMGAYKSKMTKVEKANPILQSKDKVEISSKARDFQVAMQAFSKLPEVRQEKVDEVKKAMQSGAYNPSAQEITNKILENVSIDKKV